MTMTRRTLLGRLLAMALFVPMLYLAQPAFAKVTITFYSHDFGSHWPHAFFTLKGTLDSTGEAIDSNYGFTPVTVGPNILFGNAKGRLDIATPKYIADSDPHFAMEISDAEYAAVIAIVHKWRDKPQGSYNLNKANCVHFVAEAVRAVGLKTNPKSKYFKKPKSFMIEVTDLNRSQLSGAQILYKAKG